MLNEERVKYMTKLAFYETKGGEEDLKISFYHKKDYIGLNTFWAGLTMTLAYIALVLVISSSFMNDVWGKVSSSQLTVMLLSFFGIYLILLFLYIKGVRFFYKKKHARAYHRVKKFKDELEQLEKMYEKEDGNE